MSNNMFDTDEQYRRQLFKELVQIAEELGWNIVIPSDGYDDEEVPGLIMGVPEYIEEVLDKLEDEETQTQ